MATVSEMPVMRSAEALFEPVSVGGFELRNRFVMAPMTRAFSPNATPGDDVVEYYAKRARGGVGLIITEGTFVPHEAASHNGNIPNFHGAGPLAGWRKVADAVHAAGSAIIPQIWHVGLLPKRDVKGVTTSKGGNYEVSPSGYINGTDKVAEPMSTKEIDDVIQAFGEAAKSALDLGFDGIEVHGAHGYLIDQFLWAHTNRRTDGFGGSLAARSRFAAEIVRECRARTHATYPIVFRFSQWKQQDYSARLATTPGELEEVLGPITEAGVDMYHCSQRRYWTPEFEDSNLSLTAWTKKVTGKPAIIVGSVGLDRDMSAAGFAPNSVSGAADIDRLIDMFDEGQFDLVAVGRALIGSPDWCELVRRGDWNAAVAYSVDFLQTLS